MLCRLAIQADSDSQIFNDRRNGAKGNANESTTEKDDVWKCRTVQNGPQPAAPRDQVPRTWTQDAAVRDFVYDP